MIEVKIFDLNKNLILVLKTNAEIVNFFSDNQIPFTNVQVFMMYMVTHHMKVVHNGINYQMLKMQLLPLVDESNLEYYAIK